MKRILFLLSSNKYSGAEKVICTIIENFKNNYEMAYCSPKGSIINTLKEKDILYFGVDKMNINNIKKVISEFKPDIIHANDYKASVLSTLCGFKGKIISHLHINAPFAKYWNLKSFIYYARCNKFDKVIGVSNSVYNECVFKKKIKNKYITLYNYVDTKNVIKLSNEYKCNEEYDLVFLGRLNKLKNPEIFIKVIYELKKTKDDIKAVIIGEGELYNQCIKLIKKLSLTKNIDMVGFINNPFPIVKKCRVCIMPSIVEGFGLTAIEALALNKPVLNSGVGGLKEIFQDNELLICNSINDYVANYNKIITSRKKYNFNKIIMKYSDKKDWKKKIISLYK